MTTPEGKIKDKVKKVLKSMPWVYYHMPVMNGMGKPTLDFIICANSRFFAVETKAPGQKPTPRQTMTMEEMTQAGGFVFVVSCDAELAILEAYLNLFQP
jgi:hypothetical protein